MPDPQSPPEIPPGIPIAGEIFAGKYRIEGVLGIGGMGAVLAARHLHLDEKVAIKVMLPDVAEDGSKSVRFLREARAAVKIKSEHVAKVMDFGQLGSGQAYMVLEYLVGEDLAATLDRRGKLPVAETVEILLQASEAVAQAHALGIVHRDLKPANLFLTARDDGSQCIKVLDFGISKGTAQDGSLQSLDLTKTQSIVGSPAYMAPEQMRTSQPLDARTDIWSLGVVGYELLTGRVPFDARSMSELTAMVLQDDPPPIDRPDIPADLARAIGRCLAKKPQERFADLSAFAAAIAPFGAKGAEDLALRVGRAKKSGNVAGTSLPGVAATPDSAESAPRARAHGVAGSALAPTAMADAATASTRTGAEPARRSQRRWMRVGAGLVALAAVSGLWWALAGSRSREAMATSQPSAATEPSSAPTPPAPAAASADMTSTAPGEARPSAQEVDAASAPPPRPPAVHRAQGVPASSAVKKSSAPASVTSRPQPPRPPSIEDQRKN